VLVCEPRNSERRRASLEELDVGEGDPGEPERVGVRVRLESAAFQGPGDRLTEDVPGRTGLIVAESFPSAVKVSVPRPSLGSKTRWNLVRLIIASSSAVLPSMLVVI